MNAQTQKCLIDGPVRAGLTLVQAEKHVIFEE